MKMKMWFLLLAAPVLLIVSCEDDTKPLRKYVNGVFIVNEGNFMSGNGTITFYDSATETVFQNIFVNDAGDFAGDVVQSMIFHEGVPIIVVNGDSKLEVAHGLTFKSVKTITDELIDKPRYVEVINDKAYISVWGPYDEFFSLVDSYVLVYDFPTNSVVDTIQTDEGTENLLYTGSRLFASNYNYGASSTVSAIDPANNTLLENIQVSAGPAGMVEDINGKLWVICVGGWGAENGYLYRINPATLEIEENITITGAVGIDLATTPDKQHILYTIGTSVFSLPISATEEATDALFVAEDVTLLSALSVDPSGNIWIGDAPSFTAPGKVYVYSSTGISISSMAAGIAPTQIVFNFMSALIIRR
jgi:hypothetical protein